MTSVQKQRDWPPHTGYMIFNVILGRWLLENPQIRRSSQSTVFSCGGKSMVDFIIQKRDGCSYWRTVAVAMGLAHECGKKCLQERLADQYGIIVTVAHYPSGASKWNPIEHRMFNEISKNWSGVPLETFDTLVNFAKKTKTKFDDILIRSLDLPLLLLIFTSGGVFIERMAPIASSAELTKYVFVGFKAVTIVAIVLFIERLTNGLIEEYTPKYDI